MRKIRIFWVWLLVFLPIAALAQSDLARELRLEAELVDSILDGEPIKLPLQGREFLGIYTESSLSETKGGVLVLHGRGFHPDWTDVVSPLRVGLAEQGWNTLSLQMPVLPKASKYYEYVPIFPESVPRIQAGIDYLRKQGTEKVIIVAHSCGAHMSMAWFREHADVSIDGYVGIGMGATDYRQPMERPFPLDEFKVPVLDLYGSEDYPAVHRYAPDRLIAIRSAGHSMSSQQMIDGANHYFSGADDVLIEAVSTWLEKLITPE